MEIRELHEKDLKSLIQLYTQLDQINEDLSYEKSLSIWKNEIEPNGSIKYFGAVENERVVSSCYCVIIPNLTVWGKSIGFVENVVTDAEFRRQGLAKKVIGEAVKFAEERGCYKVILQSGAQRHEAHKLYESMGFNSQTKKAFDMRIPL